MLLRGVVAATAAIGLVLIVRTDYRGWLLGWDLAVYLEAANRFGDLYACDRAGHEACYLYSPAFAALVWPIAQLPGYVALFTWRVLSLALLYLSARGMGLATIAVMLAPGIAWDALAGNVTTLSLAAMIAVVRWPSVRTVALYALLVAFVPKPQFLPVLAWGFVMVPEARRYVVGAGLLGLVMLAWPGYFDALLLQRESTGGAWRFPVLIPLGVVLTGASLRWPVLLGPASVAAAAFLYPYNLMYLALVPVSRHRQERSLDVRVRDERGRLRAVDEQDAPVQKTDRAGVLHLVHRVVNFDLRTPR